MVDTPRTAVLPSNVSPWRFVPIAIVLCGLAFGYFMGWQRYLTLAYLSDSHDALKDYVAGNYAAAIAAFFAVYTLAVAFSFPAASILTIFAGFLFGWIVGGVIVAFAATLGATAIFLAARSAFGDFLTRQIGGRAASLADGFERNAFGYLLVLRLAPIFPFFVMNVVPALFGVRLKTYVAATFIGILPGVAAYAWLGQGVDGALLGAREAGRAPALGDLVTPEITLAFAALALVAAIPTVVRKIRSRDQA